MSNPKDARPEMNAVRLDGIVYEPDVHRPSGRPSVRCALNPLTRLMVTVDLASPAPSEPRQGGHRK